MVRVSVPSLGSQSTNSLSLDKRRNENVKEVKGNEWASQAGEVVFDHIENVDLESLVVRHSSGTVSALKWFWPIGQAFHG